MPTTITTYSIGSELTQLNDRNPKVQMMTPMNSIRCAPIRSVRYPSIGPKIPDLTRASENAPEIAVRLQPNSRSKEGKKALIPKYLNPVLTPWVTQPPHTTHHSS